ncbi:MAG: DUF3276 family protein [Deltaproteobacteria bacterium]
MENGDKKKVETVYSLKIKAGKRRTYFFDVRETKGGDYFITLTESTKKFGADGYERHKIFIYKEDFNRFLRSLEETVTHVKTNLMPNFDFDEYERRQEEWERQQAESGLTESEDKPAEKSHTEEDMVW